MIWITVNPFATRSSIRNSRPSSGSRRDSPIHHVSPSQLNGVPETWAKCLRSSAMQMGPLMDKPVELSVPATENAPVRPWRPTLSGRHAVDHCHSPSACQANLAFQVLPPSQKAGRETTVPPASRNVTLSSISRMGFAT